MSKGLSTGTIIGIVVLLILVWGVSSYNGLVSTDESINEKWNNVQADYQRRADLIPNLVSSVKSYTNYEGSVLTEVTAARAAWTGATTQGAQIKAAQQMDSALSRLIAVAENYPNLKANENYLSLQDELAGTENRIKLSRTEYNAAIKAYNVKVRRVPTNIIAGLFGFEQRTGFEAEEGASQAPDVGALLQ